MCGITAWIAKGAKQQIEQATARLAHRGPDHQGTFFDAKHGVALGHRRLSILDLSEAAHQPAHSHNGRYVMVYNGEVYNFKELRNKLQQQGHGPFKTQGDTEVILEAFVAWGPDFVQALNGMFVIAIFDKETGSLNIWRDRMGIKPLYYRSLPGQGFACASELKALRLPEDEVYGGALNAYLHLGYIPGPDSIWKGVHKLAPGHCLARSAGGSVHIAPWWSVETAFAGPGLSKAPEAIDTLDALLQDAVGQRLVSDVPFGTFLSGGVDSSLVTALASKHYGPGLRTFSIAMDTDSHDESPYAEQVAKALNTNHTTFRIQAKDCFHWVERLPQIYDEPYGDASAVPSLVVSELARKHVTMVLTGDGGDELFHGYGAYRWAERLQQFPWSWGLARGLASKIFATGPDRYRRIGRLLRMPAQGISPQAHLFGQEQYFFLASEVARLTGSLPSDRVSTWQPPAWLSSADPATRQAMFDQEAYLPDDLLVKMDRASMQHSLEARVPLLDFRIVEFAAALDSKLKRRDGVDKYLLKEVLYRHLPRELFERPKWGFSIPLNHWLRGGLKELVGDMVLSESAYSHGLVDKQAALNLVQPFFKRGSQIHYQQVWLLLQLNLWHAQQFTSH